MHLFVQVQHFSIVQVKILKLIMSSHDTCELLKQIYKNVILKVSLLMFYCFFLSELLLVRSENKLYILIKNIFHSHSKE